ncbi:DUF7096 domain-containing protein [Natronorubrum bangense]|uniref:Uncharacterized protein n=2 Tax=Natronorubrum bangense TaxID=61858 RepID=L9WJH9_9EURY|nr:hypothetical protein [Natronorubrum bangense]ELY48493.1 hypothetical protein C494_10780 [Natronorubrum bangense JCM 10635]QCC53828.1 hypothetical protein DV706_04595 [Natronorubrum bangense]
MNSATSALLALLLVFSLVAIPVAAGPGDGMQAQLQAEQQEQTTDDDAAEATTNRLSLEGEIRSETVRYGADLGVVLQSTDDELRTDYTTYTILDREFNDAGEDEQEAMVDDVYDRIIDRAAELEEREEAAVEAHAAGQLSTTELLQIVLRNHNEAAVLSDALDHIDDRTDRIDDYSLSIQDQQDALEMHRTPVRAQLESAANGIEDGTVITVETSEEGYALSLINSNYIREATIFDNREAAWGSDFDDISDAYEYAGELYPWVFENRQSAGAREHTDVNLYHIEASHDQGQLEAYLDGGTGEVYREVQELSHTSLPTETETIWSSGDYRLSLNETPASGPAKLTVTDATTNESKTATVAVDGFEIGTTDGEGTIWFVPPAESYELTVTAEDERIELTVGN